MIIKILGIGCSKCKQLMNLTIQVVEELKLDAEIQKIEDIQEIMIYGVMSIPALIVDDMVIFSGKIPTLKELINIFYTLI